MEELAQSFIAFGKTDIGQKRSSNQDSIFVDNNHFYYLVADGMGGHKGGDIASSMACDLIPKYLFNSENSSIDQRLIEAMTKANHDIVMKGSQNENLEGMGTTAVSFYYIQEDNKLKIINVGDSRAYLISDQKIYQLSRDNSLIQEKLNLNIYSRKVALKDPQKNILTRTVGFEENIEIDIYDYTPMKNQLFLLCSDGLHGLLTNEEILKICSKFFSLYNLHNQDQDQDQQKDDITKKLDTICTELILRANQNGGNDNISVILAFSN